MGSRQLRNKQERMCVVHRKIFPREELFRFVCHWEYGLMVDFREKLPGRGLWVKADRETVEFFFSVKMQKYILKKFDIAHADWPAWKERFFDHVRDQFLNSIGILNRCALIVVGFDRILLLHKKQKLFRIYAAQESSANQRLLLERQDFFILLTLSVEQLSSSLGKNNVPYIAIKECVGYDKMYSNMKRFENFLKVM